jgi:hypothetical protein
MFSFKSRPARCGAAFICARERFHGSESSGFRRHATTRRIAILFLNKLFFVLVSIWRAARPHQAAPAKPRTSVDTPCPAGAPFELILNHVEDGHWPIAQSSQKNTNTD